MEQQPASRPKKHFHAAWLLVIVVPGFVIGGLLCRGQTFADTCSIIWYTLEIVAILCAVPLGISYGVQDKEFWS